MAEQNSGLSLKSIALFSVMAVIIVLLLNKSCSQGREIEAIRDNIEYLTKNYNDTIKSYKDKNGNLIAEKRVLIIENEDLKKVIGMNKNDVFVETIEVRVYDTIYNNTEAKPIYIHDTITTAVNDVDLDTVTVSKKYKKGSYINYTLTGYGIDKSLKNMTVDSNIRLEQTLDENGLLKITTDCTDLNFVNMNSSFYDNSKDRYKHRKRFGPGINVGVGYDVISQKPYIGVGVGINFTPKKWQF